MIGDGIETVWILQRILVADHTTIYRVARCCFRTFPIMRYRQFTYLRDSGRDKRGGPALGEIGSNSFCECIVEYGTTTQHDEQDHVTLPGLVFCLLFDGHRFSHFVNILEDAIDLGWADADAMNVEHPIR